MRSSDSASIQGFEMTIHWPDEVILTFQNKAIKSNMSSSEPESMGTASKIVCKHQPLILIRQFNKRAGTEPLVAKDFAALSKLGTI